MHLLFFFFLEFPLHCLQKMIKYEQMMYAVGKIFSFRKMFYSRALWEKISEKETFI